MCVSVRLDLRFKWSHAAKNGLNYFALTNARSDHASWKDRTLLICHWKECDMRVTFPDRTDLHPMVELALGREVRTLQLDEFIDFMLTIVEEGRKSTTAYLESLEEFPQDKDRKERKAPFTHMHLGSIHLMAICMTEGISLRLLTILVPRLSVTANRKSKV